MFGDILIEHPIVVLNLPQARAEITDPTPVKDKGGQEALQAIYPLHINELRIARRVFETGSISVSGWADFLADPYAAFMLQITLDAIALDYFDQLDIVKTST